MQSFPLALYHIQQHVLPIDIHEEKPRDLEHLEYFLRHLFIRKALMPLLKEFVKVIGVLDVDGTDA